MRYHKSVLLNESIKGLNINPDGIYVDVTFGGGGHSERILQYLDSGRLFAFDMDLDVRRNILERKNFKLLRANYRNIRRFLRAENILQVDGILADLGVSSYQIDASDRGFSFRFDNDLDMRMNQSASLTAKEVINDYSFEDLSNIFYKYGEIRDAKKVADRITSRRCEKEIRTTFDLVRLLDGLYNTRKRNQFLAQVFQSIRIEVNDEVESLKLMLEQGASLLKCKGRFVVISYHSLEDRLVKNLFKKGNVEGRLEKDFFGNKIQNLHQVNKKVITPLESEVQDNNRSRSAKLRIAEKV